MFHISLNKCSSSKSTIDRQLLETKPVTACNYHKMYNSLIFKTLTFPISNVNRNNSLEQKVWTVLVNWIA